MGTCFKSGKDKAVKGEGWALPSYAVAKLQWTSNLHCSYGHLAIENHYFFTRDSHSGIKFDFLFKPVPGCSKLTALLVNVSLKFQRLLFECTNIFVEKWEKLSAKNMSLFGNKVGKHLMS